MSNFTRPTLPTRASAFCRRLLPMILLAPVAVLLGAWSFQDGEEKVTIKGEDVPLLTVFKSIKKQAGYNFFYAANFVNDKERVSVNMQNARVDDVLRKVLGRDYVWVYNDNAVSITKKKAEVRRSSPPAAPVKDSSVNQITVSGSVTDAKGTPIPGATVMVKGTHDGASTDENGHFSLAGVRPNAVLVISSVGFEKREVPVKGKTIWAKLNVSVNDLDEAVVVSYGRTTQRKNVGAVTVVKGKDIESMPYRSFDKSLQGQVPGLLVTSGSGQPGSGLSNFVLRGIGTGSEAGYGSTVRNPLIIIDGTPVQQNSFQLLFERNSTPVTNPLAQLNTSDIESISVLKDAAAIALYGTRAANGVILVTTKKGKAGKTRINFSHQTDIAFRYNGKLKPLSQQEYLELIYESYRNARPGVTDDSIRADLFTKFPYRVSSSNDTSFYPAPGWLDALTNNTALTVSNNLSFSGGNQNGSFYLNFEYITQDGVIRNTGYDRASVRYNFNNRPAAWLEVGMNTTLSYNKQDYTSFMESATDPLGLSYTMSPLNPIYLENGQYQLLYRNGTSWPYSPLSNPVASQEYNINRATSYRGLSNVYAEASALKFFKLRSSLGVDYMQSYVKQKIDPRLTDQSQVRSPGIGSIEEHAFLRTTVITTNTLRFDRELLGRHTLGILVGQEAQVFVNKNLATSAQGFSAPFFDEVSNGAITQAGSQYVNETLLSFFSRANYAYKNKYLISLSARRDGSSRFGRQERYGNYWSLGAGWVISDEAFMQRTSNWLSFWKLRGSLGTSGSNAAIGYTSRYDMLTVRSYAGNGAVQTSSSAADANLKWEEAFNQDLGMEVRLVQDRISLTLDVYKRKISNLLYPVKLPGTSGYRTVISNVGSIENKGVEIALAAGIIRRRDFQWTVNANWSTNRNRLLKANLPLFVSQYLVAQEGENFQSFYLNRWAGVNPEDGSPQWYDKQGKLTSEILPDDKVIVGKPQPDGFGSVSMAVAYKGLELSAVCYYQYGFQVYDRNLQYFNNDGSFPLINQVSTALDRWQQPGDKSTNPKRVFNNTSRSNNGSTRYLFDGDFIRLNNLVLSYSIPQSTINRWKLAKAEVFVQGNNLFIWTKYPGGDPNNVGSSGTAAFAYPQQRSFSLGLNIGF